tara:strand:+ start:39 stop:779 length:741 start_codon:yes stop_codon:yes gene_type:complete
MANGIDYRIGPSNKTLEAMLKSDVPDIVTQAQEIIKSQGLENIDMGQNQLTQTMDPILQDVLQKRPEPEGIMKFADLADQYSNFMFQPRVGKFSISDALGIVSNNPYSMALTGITGAVQGLGALQDRFGIAGVPTVDQFGNLYTGEQLDRMNALGGYYSDPARQSRSRDRRIQSIFDRRVAGKSFSQKVLDDLLEKRAQEEAARQAAATRMQQQNREEGTGGYQSDFSQDSDFMEGSGTAAEMGSF